MIYNIVFSMFFSVLVVEGMEFFEEMGQNASSDDLNKNIPKLAVPINPDAYMRLTWPTFPYVKQMNNSSLEKFPLNDFLKSPPCITREFLEKIPSLNLSIPIGLWEHKGTVDEKVTLDFKNAPLNVYIDKYKLTYKRNRLGKLDLTPIIPYLVVPAWFTIGPTWTAVGIFGLMGLKFYEDDQKYNCYAVGTPWSKFIQNKLGLGKSLKEMIGDNSLEPSYTSDGTILMYEGTVELNWFIGVKYKIHLKLENKTTEPPLSN